MSVIQAAFAVFEAVVEVVGPFVSRLFGAFRYASSKRFRQRVHEEWQEKSGMSTAVDICGALVGAVLLLAVVFWLIAGG